MIRRLALVLLLLALPGVALATDGDRPGLPDATVDPQRFGQKTPDPAYGAFQRGLYRTAYNLALVRAQKGDPAAQTLVAEILARGLGVAQNGAEAAKWYGLAAEQGIAEAQFQYALILLDGVHAPRDAQRAFALMEDAANSGNRLAQFNFAQLLTSRSTGESGLARAVTYYEQAADAGLADAQYAMAQILSNGVGGSPIDEAKARTYLLKAARQNYDTAQLELGIWLIEGRGGQRDYEAGFGWMRAAAEAGNVIAQNRMAKLYRAGIGVEPDSNLAAAWYILSRRAGLNDPLLDDFLAGLTGEEQKKAVETANRLR